MKLPACLIILIFTFVNGFSFGVTLNNDKYLPAKPNLRIYGGNPTNITEFPYMVNIYYYGKQNCGGSIISKNYVLTAAHCIYTRNPDDLTVRSGSSYSNRGGMVHKVLKTIAHKNYQDTPKHVYNDIGLIKVHEPFKYDASTKPISIINKGYELKAGEIGTISGWGTTESTDYPKVLMTTNVPIVDKTLCEKAYLKYREIFKTEFCAGYYEKGEKDSCVGDSGGPLVINGVTAGIISHGAGCAQPYFPGIYADVSRLHDWIVKNANLETNQN